MPPSTSESYTFLPNSVGLSLLPRQMISVWGSKMEISFSEAGTLSPSSTLRSAWEITRMRRPEKCSIVLPEGSCLLLTAFGYLSEQLNQLLCPLYARASDLYEFAVSLSLGVSGGVATELT